MVVAVALLLSVISGVTSKCLYYQENGIAFPTDRCTNSTVVNGRAMSVGYYCYEGLFRTSIYQYTFNNPNCAGSPSQTLYGSCSPPECDCASNGSPSQCVTSTVSYDSNLCGPSKRFNEQNLTIITDECVNGVIFTEKDGRIFYNQCGANMSSMQPTCYSLDAESRIDPYSTSPPLVQNKTNFSLEGYKGIFIISVVGIMVIGTFCSLCCMMKRFRKKQRNQIDEAHQRNLIDPDDDELNEEGIQNEFEQEQEQNIIPGQIEIKEVDQNQVDQNVVDQILNQYINDIPDDDDEDIPVAAYSDYNHNDDEIEISEGNEGIQDQQSTDDEAST